MGVDKVHVWVGKVEENSVSRQCGSRQSVGGKNGRKQGVSRKSVRRQSMGGKK